VPVLGTTYHPLNPDDAELLQEQLLIAGYYQSPPEGIWGMDSRNALRKRGSRTGLEMRLGIFEVAMWLLQLDARVTQLL
jgi:hypothetical protein